MEFRLLVHFYRDDKYVGQILTGRMSCTGDLDGLSESIRNLNSEDETREKTLTAGLQAAEMLLFGVPKPSGTRVRVMQIMIESEPKSK